jgi:hypothetical protein
MFPPPHPRQVFAVAPHVKSGNTVGKISQDGSDRGYLPGVEVDLPQWKLTRSIENLLILARQVKIIDPIAGDRPKILPG